MRLLVIHIISTVSQVVNIGPNQKLQKFFPTGLEIFHQISPPNSTLKEVLEMDQKLNMDLLEFTPH